MKMEAVQDQVKKVFSNFLDEKGYRKTIERFVILEEIYNQDGNFNIKALHEEINKKRLQISLSSVHNTVGLLMECKLIHKAHFEDYAAQYEEPIFNENDNYIILTDSGDRLKFNDPRIDEIQKELEEKFDIKINKQSFYLFGNKNR